jgi:hypothetical protein
LIFADATTRQILAVTQACGKTHDFALFKRSTAWLNRNAKLICDLGFLGIKDLFPNAEHPKKKSKHHPLTKEEKTENKRISSRRIAIEHINCRLKRFKILSYPYRGNRKKLLLRTTLISALINLNIS